MQSKVSDEIIESLRRDISTGKLAPGTRLPSEKDLAREYGVSQPTMREVVRVLDVMGLIEVRHGSGAWVRGDGGFLLRSSLETMLQLQNVSILQVLDARALLGRDSGLQAATAATAEDIESIYNSYRRLESVGSCETLNELIDSIAGFQLAVSQAAHNPLQGQIEHFLIDLLLHLQFKVMSERGLAVWKERAAEFQPDRRAILEALERRDPAAAEGAVANYLQHQHAVFVADPDLAELRLADPRAVTIARELRQSGDPRKNRRPA
ncbi:FadR/GntR family transcriptional regulator [Rhodococcus opacus]|uniref:FadR/GntR family transcriptional regulator n=1 Tax=Rhodococcus opacus TaxID=37919 RepID=UPI001C497957|nr:GntR family transcriptional regulator [Rhodococcus opacus]MBV6760429.1 GntR family transcriptional regulator [Rhodococcus opacus]